MKDSKGKGFLNFFTESFHAVKRKPDSKDSAGDSLDVEVSRVTAEYESKSIALTTDEAVGIALARIYARCPQHEDSGLYTLKIATRGRYALEETGECLWDAVFDPKLRKKMVREQGKMNCFTPSDFVQAYRKLCQANPQHGIVGVYYLKSSDFFNIPEYLLYGLTIAYLEENGVGHAVRIIALEKSGVRVVEGNYNGRLNIGRFIKFDQLIWNTHNRRDEILVFNRHPRMRLIGVREVTPSDFEDPKIYAEFKRLEEDINKFDYLKIVSRELFYKLPQAFRNSLLVFRLRKGYFYNFVDYNDVCAKQPDIVNKWLDQMVYFKPAGKIVALLWVARGNEDIFSSYQLPKKKAKEMYVYGDIDKPGGKRIPLYDYIKILESVVKEPNLADRPIICQFPKAEFEALDEKTKQTIEVLNPKLDDNNDQVVIDQWQECLKLQSVNSESSNVEEMKKYVTTIDEDGLSETMLLDDLMDNPLNALIIFDCPFDIVYFLGSSCRLSPQEERIINKISFRSRPKYLDSKYVKERLAEVQKRRSLVFGW